ncbi:MAG: hypothetical protein SNJ66_04375 [Chloroherpetonaceae bacterium]
MSPRQVAELIANGHAYQKHVVQQKEFPEVESVTAFVDLVQYVIVSGRKKLYRAEELLIGVQLQRRSSSILLIHRRMGLHSVPKPEKIISTTYYDGS